MLRKTKKQSHLNLFFDENQQEISQEKTASSEKQGDKIGQIAEEQKSRKLSGFDPKISNSSSIISAKAGNITDMGGPSKQLKTPISNNIFDPSKNIRESQKMDGKQKTQEIKETIQTNRRTAEGKRMDELIENLKETNLTKGSAINRTETGNVDKSNYKKLSNSMSIFDSKDFERLPEKTAGEILKEEREKERNQKDDSWKHDGSTLKSSNLVNNLFDILSDKK